MKYNKTLFMDSAVLMLISISDSEDTTRTVIPMSNNTKVKLILRILAEDLKVSKCVVIIE